MNILPSSFMEPISHLSACLVLDVLDGEEVVRLASWIVRDLLLSSCSSNAFL